MDIETMDSDDANAALMIQRLKDAAGKSEPLSVSLRTWRKMSDDEKAQVVKDYNAAYPDTGPDEPAPVFA